MMLEFNDDTIVQHERPSFSLIVTVGNSNPPSDSAVFGEIFPTGQRAGEIITVTKNNSQHICFVVLSRLHFVPAAD
jgi:hypothetical protein